MTRTSACPFCGDSWITVVVPRNGRYYGACRCGAAGPAADCRDAAISAWNTRVASAPDAYCSVCGTPADDSGLFQCRCTGLPAASAPAQEPSCFRAETLQFLAPEEMPLAHAWLGRVLGDPRDGQLAACLPWLRALLANGNGGEQMAVLRELIENIEATQKEHGNG